MHEMSLAQNILEIVQRTIPAGSENRVKTIRLKVGEAAGVVPDSLQFCFQAITERTPLHQSQLTIDHVPLSLQCRVCNSINATDMLLFICPACGSNNVNVLSGTELDVIDIEIEEPEEEKA